MPDDDNRKVSAIQQERRGGRPAVDDISIAIIFATPGQTGSRVPGVRVCSTDADVFSDDVARASL